VSLVLDLLYSVQVYNFVVNFPRNIFCAANCSQLILERHLQGEYVSQVVPLRILGPLLSLSEFFEHSILYHILRGALFDLFVRFDDAELSREDRGH